jgi:hypothetical protein
LSEHQALHRKGAGLFSRRLQSAALTISSLAPKFRYCLFACFSQAYVARENGLSDLSPGSSFCQDFCWNIRQLIFEKELIKSWDPLCTDLQG